MITERNLSSKYGVFTKEQLDRIPNDRIREFYISIADEAFLRLKLDRDIKSYIPQERNYRCDNKPDFFVLSRKDTVIAFKITKTSGKAMEIAADNPWLQTIGIMDIYSPSQTKPTFVLMNDIRDRIRQVNAR